MSHKYIYNEQGEKEAVIIPISEWEKIRKLTHKETKAEKTSLAAMIGAAKGDFKAVQDVDAHINKLRDEWD